MLTSTGKRRQKASKRCGQRREQKDMDPPTFTVVLLCLAPSQMTSLLPLSSSPAALQGGGSTSGPFSDNSLRKPLPEHIEGPITRARDKLLEELCVPPGGAVVGASFSEPPPGDSLSDHVSLVFNCLPPDATATRLWVTRKAVGDLCEYWERFVQQLIQSVAADVRVFPLCHSPSCSCSSRLRSLTHLLSEARGPAQAACGQGGRGCVQLAEQFFLFPLSPLRRLPSSPLCCIALKCFFSPPCVVLQNALALVRRPLSGSLLMLRGPRLALDL